MTFMPSYLLLLSGLRVLLTVDLDVETSNFIDLSAPEVIDYKDPCKAGNVTMFHIIWDI